MSAFIVSGGSLLEIGCPSTLTRSTEQQVSFTPIIGGRVKAFVRKGGRRAWSVDVSVARPGEVSTLEAVARGLGPYGWYPPEAVVGNLLSPQASGFDALPVGATDADLVQLPDGTVARAAVHTGAGDVSPVVSEGVYDDVPVRQGSVVSVGGWGRGGVRFTGFWLDAAGASLGSWSTAGFAFSGWGWRERQLTVPTGAAFLRLSLSAGAQYALPSVSWGDKARAELGTGCPKAVVHSPSHTPVALWKGANYTNTSYSVTEVG